MDRVSPKEIWADDTMAGPLDSNSLAVISSKSLLVQPLHARWPRAQGERVRHIGVLVNFAQTDREGQTSVAAFVATLRQLGWIDGRNLRSLCRCVSAPAQDWGFRNRLS